MENYFETTKAIIFIFVDNYYQKHDKGEVCES